MIDQQLRLLGTTLARELGRLVVFSAGCVMSFLEGRDLDQYRITLRQRADTLNIDPRVQVRVDESDLVQATLIALHPSRRRLS